MNFSSITQTYPKGILTGVDQYFFRNKWHSIPHQEGPPQQIDADHEPEHFAPLIKELLGKGATKIALSVLDPVTKTQYTVFVRAAEFGQLKPAHQSTRSQRERLSKKTAAGLPVLLIP